MTEPSPKKSCMKKDANSVRPTEPQLRSFVAKEITVLYEDFSHTEPESNRKKGVDASTLSILTKNNWFIPELRELLQKQIDDTGGLSWIICSGLVADRFSVEVTNVVLYDENDKLENKDDHKYIIDARTKITVMCDARLSFTPSNAIDHIELNVANYDIVDDNASTLATAFKEACDERIKAALGTPSEGVMPTKVFGKDDVIVHKPSGVTFTVMRVFGAGTFSEISRETHVEFFVQGLHGIPANTTETRNKNPHFDHIWISSMNEPISHWGSDWSEKRKGPCCTHCRQLIDG
jgi:hypothetical protein